MSTIQIHTNDIYYRYKSNLNIDYTKYDISIQLIDYYISEKQSWFLPNIQQTCQ